jgi:hypothetical protein
VNISHRISSPPAAVRAGLAAGVVAFLPAIAWVLTRSSAHWPAFLALGGACAVGAGVCFGVYFRFATAFVDRRTIARRMRIAAGAEPAGLIADPLEQDEIDLEARFSALERSGSNERCS